MPSKGKNTGMEVENAILLRGGRIADRSRKENQLPSKQQSWKESPLSPPMKLWLVNGPYDTLHLQEREEEDPKSHKAEACSTNDTSGDILGSGRT